MPFVYALIGLPPAERALIESVFQLGAEQDADELSQTKEPAGAQLLVVNSDDPESVRALRQAHPNVPMLLVGRRVPAVDAPAIARPLSVNSVLQVFGALPWTDEADSGHRAATHPRSDTRHPRSGSQFGRPDRSGSANRDAEPARQPVAPVQTGEHASDAAALVSQPDSGLTWPPSNSADDLQASIVVVARPSTRSLALRRLGYRVHLVDGADAALARMAVQPVRMFFLDHGFLRQHTLPLARTLTARRQTPGGPPYVAVVSSGGSTLERLRARALGCAWMKLPIERERLLAYLDKRGLRPETDLA